MSIVAKFKHNQQSTSGSLTGAAPQQGNGATLQMPTVAVGSLSASLSSTITVNSLTYTGKWQVSADGSTWVDCFPNNNATQVTIQTGTGSTVTTTRRVDAPASVYGERYARYAVVTGAQDALGAASEEYTIAYNYRPVSIITSA